jgi:hypothetical protein
MTTESSVKVTIWKSFSSCSLGGEIGADLVAVGIGWPVVIGDWVCE